MLTKKPRPTSDNGHVAQGEFARRVAVGQQSLNLGAVGGAKVNADVSASHPQFMLRLSRYGPM